MANLSGYEAIEFARDGRILTVTMNRPASLNAFDAELHEELSRAVYDMAADKDSDIIVLTGAGRAFSAGGDINWMQDAIDDPDSFEVTVREGKKIVFGLLDCEKPVIARLNGDAVGLGATIALLCDIVIASKTCRIGDPHVNVGLVAGDGGAVIWPQLIGYARAKEMLLTGRLLSADEAERMGLVNRVVEAGKLDEVVGEMAARLQNGAIKAIRWTKTVTNIPLKQLAHTMMDACMAYEMASNISADHRAAVRAFRERRLAKRG